jgi:hypothetical protein
VAEIWWVRLPLPPMPQNLGDKFPPSPRCSRHCLSSVEYEPFTRTVVQGIQALLHEDSGGPAPAPGKYDWGAKVYVGGPIRITLHQIYIAGPLAGGPDFFQGGRPSGPPHWCRRCGGRKLQIDPLRNLQPVKRDERV